jgi:integrase
MRRCGRAISSRARPGRSAAYPAPVEIAFLTLEEIRALKAAECPNAEVQRAFLFSCFTGMARCDVRTLTWGQVKDGWVRYRRQKTKETVSVEAAEAIGEPGNDGELVFGDMPSDRYVGHALTKWAQRANVSKNVTYHVARHTFATLSLTHGANLYTISKLLGHTSVKITQEYAKVVDKAKEDAVRLLPLLDW